MQIKKYYEFVNESISELSADQLKFLEDSVKGRWTQNSQGSIDVTGSVVCPIDIKKIPVQFNKITKDFTCHNCSLLTSLKGAPHTVGGSFNCGKCVSLTSLEYAPSSVKIDFYCHDCINIVSLKTTKQLVKKFACSGCTSLESIEDSPIASISYSCANCTLLTSLKGAPEMLEESFSCEGCVSLTSLRYAPLTIRGVFYYANCHKLYKPEIYLKEKFPEIFKLWIKSKLSYDEFIIPYRGTITAHKYNV